MTIESMIADETQIIDNLKKMPDNTRIPEEGPLGFLYSHLSGEGEILVINNGKKYQVMYKDHDQVISYLKPENAHFEVHKQDNGLLLNIFIPVDPEMIRLPLMFNLRSKSDLDTIKLIVKRKSVNINFICIEYGCLVKTRHARIILTKDVIKQLS